MNELGDCNSDDKIEQKDADGLMSSIGVMRRIAAECVWRRIGDSRISQHMKLINMFLIVPGERWSRRRCTRCG